MRMTSYNVDDEYYTPASAVRLIIPYLPKDKIIWCPFDTKNSQFVICLKEAGLKVIYSHIWYGYDFLASEPKNYDIIVSNPPYSIKEEVFKRLYYLGKPFAMLLFMHILGNQKICDLFFEKNLQLLIPTKRISFSGTNPPTGSAYFCNKLLPKQVIFTRYKY